jgi:hypothetical protein
MRYVIKIIVLLMLVFSNALASETYYLAGIGVIGQQRVAYLSLPSGMISVQEGDHITINEEDQVEIWRVKEIQSNAVIFKATGGSAFKLELDIPLPSSEEIPGADAAEESIEKVEEVETNAEVAEEKNVPPGYRVVETPFGAFMVKETEWLILSATPPPASPTPTETAFESAQLIDKPRVNQTQKPSLEKIEEKVEEKMEKVEKKVERIEDVEEIAPGSRIIETPFGKFVITNGEL